MNELDGFKDWMCSAITEELGNGVAAIVARRMVREMTSNEWNSRNTISVKELIKEVRTNKKNPDADELSVGFGLKLLSNTSVLWSNGGYSSHLFDMITWEPHDLKKDKTINYWLPHALDAFRLGHKVIEFRFNFVNYMMDASALFAAVEDPILQEDELQ